MKHISLRQIQTIASSLVSPTARDVSLSAEETTSSHALVPLRHSEHGLSTLANIPPRWLRPLDQARRQLASAGLVEDVLRPVGSGFVQALLLHALQPPGAAQTPASPQRPLRTWIRGQLAHRAASNQEPASTAQAQLPARSLRPADIAQWRYLHIEVHAWATGESTDAVLVAVQSVTDDCPPRLQIAAKNDMLRPRIAQTSPEVTP